MVTSLPADAPYFIRTTQPYISTWIKFVKEPDGLPYRFFVNPDPKNLAEVIMSPQKCNNWLNTTIAASEDVFDVSNNFIFMRDFDS